MDRPRVKPRGPDNSSDAVARQESRSRLRTLRPARHCGVETAAPAEASCPRETMNVSMRPSSADELDVCRCGRGHQVVRRIAAVPSRTSSSLPTTRTPNAARPARSSVVQVRMSDELQRGLLPRIPDPPAPGRAFHRTGPCGRATRGCLARDRPAAGACGGRPRLSPAVRSGGSRRPVGHPWPRADHQHAALRQVRGPAIPRRDHLVDTGREARGYGAARTACRDARSPPPRSAPATYPRPCGRGTRHVLG